MKGYRRHGDWVKVVHQRGPAGASSAVCAVCVMLNEYMRGEAEEGKKKTESKSDGLFQKVKSGRAAIAAERKTNTKMMPHQTCMNKLARMSGRVRARDEASGKVDRQARTEMLDGYNDT